MCRTVRYTHGRQDNSESVKTYKITVPIDLGIRVKGE